MKSKEFGSEFHYPIKNKFLLTENNNSLFSGKDFSLFFSGRAALYNILKNGIEKNNWKKVYIPSFYCHEVVHFIKTLPMETLYYEFNPFLDSAKKDIPIDDVPTNVIVNVNFFGLIKLDLKNYANAVQIEDLTHDILGYSSSSADFCFGSLRKELPLPVGGFCFSPKKNPLPRGIYNNEAEQVALQKLTAMFLKTEYLKGNWKDKNSFRKLYIDAENKLDLEISNASLPELAQEILFQLNPEKIIERKSDNIKKALALLKRSESFTFNLNSENEKVFGLIVDCKSSTQQNKFKQYLVKNLVYPAVLWPGQISERDKEVEHRILFIHLDFRYGNKDIQRIIKIINVF